jgi:hypothetical protein
MHEVVSNENLKILFTACILQIGSVQLCHISTQSPLRSMPVLQRFTSAWIPLEKKIHGRLSISFSLSRFSFDSPLYYRKRTFFVGLFLTCILYSNIRIPVDETPIICNHWGRIIIALCIEQFPSNETGML